jgi:predicted AAA+ superfamily ATPase
MENFILMELLKQSMWSKRQPEFFFWRTASGQEVHLLLEDQEGRLVAIEIKAGATLSKKDVRSLQTLASLAGKRWIRGVILYTGNEIISFGKNLHAIPIFLLWNK